MSYIEYFSLFLWLPNNILWLFLLSFLPLTINIRAGDWLLLLPFMQTPQACKSATDSWNRLPISCSHSHSFLMGLKGHKEYTNIVQHIDLNSENKRLVFVLVASIYFSPLGGTRQLPTEHFAYWEVGKRAAQTGDTNEE